MLSLFIALSTTTVTFPPKPILRIPKSSFKYVQCRRLWPVHSFLRLQTITACKCCHSSSFMVMMANIDQELDDCRAKTTEEINKEVVDLKGELFMLCLQKSVCNEFKSSKFRQMHKRNSLSVSLALFLYFQSTLDFYFLGFLLIL
ncbi:hypothetical protein ACOSQ2_030152 [Xanthoceras sorbifolium]